MKALRIVMALLFMGALVTTAFAGGQAESPAIVERIGDALEEAGWSQEEVSSFLAAAEDLDWDDTEQAPPELVARLINEIEEGEDLEPADAAQIARELAVQTDDLEEDGLAESEIAAIAEEAVAELQTQIRAWQEGDREEPLGAIIRDSVGPAVSEAARERERERRQTETEEQRQTREEAREGTPGAGAGDGGPAEDAPRDGDDGNGTGNRPDNPGAAGGR